MDQYTLNTMQTLVNSAPDTDLEPLHITILRNIVVEPIELPLQFFARKSGFQSQIRFGSFDTIFQDSLSIPTNTDVIIIFSSLLSLAPKVYGQYNSLADAEKKDLCAYVSDLSHSVLNNIRQENTTAAVIWIGFEQAPFPAVVEPHSSSTINQSGFIAQLNAALSEELNKHHNAYRIDTNHLQNSLGRDAYYDWRYWYVGKAPYSRNALSAFAHTCQAYINAIKGKTKKCLVLDCDNVLWGGIVGEDGIAGIKIGGQYPGTCYSAFQEAIVDLYHQGIIIALCSKNNQADVLDVFKNRQEMVLSLDHIAAQRINWQDKASNITALAEELNIGLDSIVFMDDNPFEIELVRAQLPTVTAIQLDKDKPVHYVETIRSLDCFGKLVLTQEDATRGKMYKDQQHRDELKKGLSLDDFIKDLGIEISIEKTAPVDLPRIAQLTQKTNQFNLSTKRYSESDIAAMHTNPQYEIITLRVSDRFGEMGIVGAAIIRTDKQQAFFDTLLLSCRALGRGIEKQFLSHVIRHLLANDTISEITASFIKTAKNQQTEMFYEDNGFTLVHNCNDEKHYTLQNDQFIFSDSALFTTHTHLQQGML